MDQSEEPSASQDRELVLLGRYLTGLAEAGLADLSKKDHSTWRDEAKGRGGDTGGA